MFKMDKRTVSFIWEGLGSVADMSSDVYNKNPREHDTGFAKDWKKLGSDWEKVGDDIRKATQDHTDNSKENNPS